MKKSKKSSKDKKSKSSTSSTSSVEASPPAAAATATPPTTASKGVMDPSAPAFSAGQLFERYSRGGGALGQNDFQRLVETEHLRPQPSPQALSRNPEDDFEVGRLFERFSQSSQGNLTQEEFGNLLRTMSGARGGNNHHNGNNGSSTNNTAATPHSSTSYASTMASANSATDAIVHMPPSTLPRALSELRNHHRSQQLGSTNNNNNNRTLPLASTELHILSMNMMSKRDQLVQQMRHVQARTEEVQSVRRAIERETIADTEAILHRLRSVEAFKLSLLNHDMTQLQHDIDEIDAFGDEMRGVDSGKKTARTAHSTHLFADPSTTGATTARGRYLETCAEGERIIQKPYKATTEVHADDFDREVADRLAMGREYNDMQEALATKDDMLVKLFNEQKEYNRKETDLTSKIEIFSQKSRQEMEEWVKLCKSLKNQLAVVKRQQEGGSSGRVQGGVELGNEEDIGTGVRSVATR